MSLYTLLFKDNAQSTLASPLTTTSTALLVTAGGAALFPLIYEPGQAFYVTIQKYGAPTTLEIVLVTLAVGSTWAITRAQQGTTALAWNAGDIISQYPTSGDGSSFVQTPQLAIQGGVYGADTGSANAYYVNLAPTYSPAISANVVGMPVRFVAAHTNSGNCTFNAGFGPSPLYLAPGVQVPPNVIVANGLYTSIWTGVYWQLQFAANLANYATLTQLFPGSNLTNDWRKNPDGSIEEWGISGTSGGPQLIPLPLELPNGILNAQFTPVGGFMETIWLPANDTVNAVGFNGAGGQVAWRIIGY